MAIDMRLCGHHRSQGLTALFRSLQKLMRKCSTSKLPSPVDLHCPRNAAPRFWRLRDWLCGGSFLALAVAKAKGQKLKSFETTCRHFSS